jgi:hypothetical protein
MMSMIFMARPEREILRDEAGRECLAAGQNSIV